MIGLKERNIPGLKGRKLEIKLIEDCGDKKKIARQILEALPDWFGMEEAREKYIKESADQIFFAAFDENQATGFLCLKETSKDTLELSVMGVLKEYHRHGIGKDLFLNAKKIASENGYSFLQVKTVQMGHYEEYDNTNYFYRSLGFKEFEVFPTLWNERNPCQIYVISLR
ncbi:MAG: GNAT family N-acetyltransferase [Sakamotonia sp.]